MPRRRAGHGRQSDQRASTWDRRVEIGRSGRCPARSGCPRTHTPEVVATKLVAIAPWLKVAQHRSLRDGTSGEEHVGKQTSERAVNEFGIFRCPVPKRGVAEVAPFEPRLAGKDVPQVCTPKAAVDVSGLRRPAEEFAVEACAREVAFPEFTAFCHEIVNSLAVKVDTDHSGALEADRPLFGQVQSAASHISPNPDELDRSAPALHAKSGIHRRSLTAFQVPNSG